MKGPTTLRVGLTPRWPGRWDVLLPGGLAVIGAVEMTTSGSQPLVVALGAYLVACLALCWRRFWPLVVPVAISSIATVAGLLGGKQSLIDSASWLLPPALACFAAGRYVPRRMIWAGGITVIAAMVIESQNLIRLAGFDADILFGLITYLGPWVLGVALHEALDRNSQLAAHAERERLLRLHAEHESAARERLRIARELHDVLAHSLTVMVVQASLAEDLIPSAPDDAIEAVRRVQDRGRAVLEEAGALIRSTRDDQISPAAITSLDELIETYRAAGLRIDAHLDDIAELPDTIAWSVRRVLGEGLTNALRHAPQPAVGVRVDNLPGSVSITIENLSTAGGVAARRMEPGAGLGLIGIRERVASFGGTFDVRNDGGRFILAVTLPLPAGSSVAR